MSAKASTTRPMYSGDLARAAGVSADTVRYYERCGLIRAVPRSAAGYRLFPVETLRRVRVIQGALAMGFSVKELGGIFRERDRGGAPCRRVRNLAAEKLAALEVRIREMQHCRRELQSALADWDRKLRASPGGQPAGLLEAFAAIRPTRRLRGSGPGALGSGNRKRETRR